MASLWLRSIDAIDAQSLDVRGGQPFWSSDGRSIGFWDAGRLKRLDLASRTVQTIADLPSMTGAAWAPDGTIVVGASPGPLLRISPGGGTPAPLTRLDANHEDHRNPFFLPGGRRFLYQSTPDNGIWVGSLDGAAPKFLRKADSKAQYAGGWLLFVSENTLFAQRLDVDRHDLEGEPRRLAEDVRINELNRRAPFTVSEKTLVYRAGDQSLDRTLILMDRSDKQVATIKDSTRPYNGLRFFPDERHVLAVIPGDVQGREDLVKIELDSGRRTNLTSDPHGDRYPMLSPEGKMVAWTSDRTTPHQIFKKPSSAGPADPDTPWIACDNGYHAVLTHWSLNWLVVHCHKTVGTGDIYVVPMDDSTPARRRPYLTTGDDERFGQLSPNERFMVYQVNEGGRSRVYFRTFPDPNGGYSQVSDSAGGAFPQWRRPDGGEIYYRSRQGDRTVVMSVSVKPVGNSLDLSAPKVLWQGPPGASATPVAITQDGQRALFAVPVQTTDAETPLTVIVNWTRLLAEK